MIEIHYKPGIVFNFPSYYGSDAGWFTAAERTTKQFLCDYIKPNFTIIDAGANIGMYTVPFSKLATEGKVYAFEPTDTINMLKTNLSFNNCSDNVILCNQPLGQFDGKKQDKVFKVWSQNVIDEKEFDFITLDTFVAQNDLKVDLLKIDVDSYDYEVLLGGKNFLMAQNPLVVVELNHALGKRGHNVQEAVEYMTEIGYNLQQILDGENFIFIKDVK
jgi:FkbM family methyltransferase